MCHTIDPMPDAPRTDLLEIIADLSDLLDDLDRGRLTRYLRTPGPPIDTTDAVDVLSLAAHDLDAIAEDLTLPWATTTPPPVTATPGNAATTTNPVLAFRSPHA